MPSIKHGRGKMIEAFDLITKYCEKHNKGVMIRNHAVCIYLSALKEVSDTTENQTLSKIGVIKATLLKEQSIAGYISRAESILDEYNQALIEPYKANDKGVFWVSVASSVVGSFLFSVIILLIFWLGKEQVKTWLQGLT